MGEKTIKIFMVFVIVVYSFFSNYVYVEAKDEYASQPAVCNGPSEMMSNYFDFQRKAIKILLGSDVNSIRFSTTFDNGWLFTDKVLKLKGVSAIDILATNALGNTKSFVSNTVTSLVLIFLTSVSVIGSNTEGFAILFKDRPIVRDYKTVLDIETNLFEVAYFRSKQINLIRDLDSASLKNSLNDLIVEYQKKGLLATGVKLNKNVSMYDVISDLVYMNTAMKHFILVGGNLGTKALQNYNGCFRTLTRCDKTYGGNFCCDKKNAIVKFSDEAINTLTGDYKDLMVLGKCNLHAKFFKSTISKTIKNNKESVKTAMNDVVSSMKRLKGVFVGGSIDIEEQESRCDLSDYEMAQLHAYWGGNWDCSAGLFNAGMSVTTTRNYFNEKIVQREQKEKNENTSKKSNKPKSKDMMVGDVADKLDTASSTNERENIWYSIFGGDSRYDPNFSYQLNSDFNGVFEETMDEFYLSQENAIASDISDLFLRGKGILDQLDDTIMNSNNLKDSIKKIEKKQCRW